ncbi:MAG TPA: hypothetical protein VL382_04395 [Terriglobales bacterium]|nr:hypothetical protein [Terriglobales bacterium]
MTRRILILLTLLAATTLAVAQKPAAKSTKPTATPTPESAKAPKIESHDILVMRPTSDEVQLPDDFRMAIYEKVIDDLAKSGRFQHIFRDGQKIPDDVKDTVKLEIIVWGFKEGSARMRQVTTVMGETRINVRVKATDPSGKELMDRNVQGGVKFFGENLHATDTLATNIAALIKRSFETGVRPVKPSK